MRINRYQKVVYEQKEYDTPYPKNPNIANSFREIGLMDCLGLGVRNVMRYVQPNAQWNSLRMIFFGQWCRCHVITYWLHQQELAKQTQECSEWVGCDSINVPDDPLNFSVTASTRRRLVQILYDVQSGLRRVEADWAKQLDVTERTVKNDFRLLRDTNLIVFQGPDKTGQELFPVISLQVE